MSLWFISKSLLTNKNCKIKFKNISKIWNYSSNWLSVHMFIILFKKKILNISNIYWVGVQSKYRYSSQLRSAATEVDVDPAVPGLVICHVPVLPHLSTKEALAVQILSSSRISGRFFCSMISFFMPRWSRNHRGLLDWPPRRRKSANT